MNRYTIITVLAITVLAIVLLGCNRTPETSPTNAITSTPKHGIIFVTVIPPIEATVASRSAAISTVMSEPRIVQIIPSIEATVVSRLVAIPTVMPEPRIVQIIPPLVSPTTTPPIEAEELNNPDETENVELDTPQNTPITDQRIEVEGKQEPVFWNERPSDLPECGTDFRFSHKLVNPEDVGQLMFGPGSHIAPHEHMVYWGLWPPGGKMAEDLTSNSGTQPSPTPEATLGEKRQISERIQLYAPTDIYRLDVGYANRSTGERENYVEWGGYIYACNGHQLMLGHIGEPSDEVLAVLAQSEPTCDMTMGYAAKAETGCGWVVDTFIPAGTPIFKSSGYAGAFDFGLSLAGLTVDELREQPGNGYSITPWRVKSGSAVCPLEYFPEPFRSKYLKLLRDNMTEQLFECGPFNQDVPNTAMGFWFPSPSPKIAPLTLSEREVDEWETIWLFESNNDPSIHLLKVGNNTFGLDYGGYQIATVSEGLVNRRWDSVEPGHAYCAEFMGEESELATKKTLIMRLSGDGLALTIEAINNDKCGEGPWSFQGGEHTFYR